MGYGIRVGTELSVHISAFLHDSLWGMVALWEHDVGCPGSMVAFCLGLRGT